MGMFSGIGKGLGYFAAKWGAIVGLPMAYFHGKNAEKEGKETWTRGVSEFTDNTIAPAVKDAAKGAWGVATDAGQGAVDTLTGQNAEGAEIPVGQPGQQQPNAGSSGGAAAEATNFFKDSIGFVHDKLVDWLGPIWGQRAASVLTIFAGGFGAKKLADNLLGEGNVVSSLLGMFMKPGVMMIGAIVLGIAFSSKIFAGNTPTRESPNNMGEVKSATALEQVTQNPELTIETLNKQMNAEQTAEFLQALNIKTPNEKPFSELTSEERLSVAEEVRQIDPHQWVHMLRDHGGITGVFGEAANKVMENSPELTPKVEQQPQGSKTAEEIAAQNKQSVLASKDTPGEPDFKVTQEQIEQGKQMAARGETMPEPDKSRSTGRAQVV